MGADWKFSAGAAGSATLTDNVNLSPPGQERSDLVLGVTPSIGARLDGARLKVNGYYSPTLLWYTNNSANNQIVNSLGALANLEAVEKFFYIDASAGISQTFISPFGPQPADLISNTDNRTETRSLSISPYIKGVFGQGITYELRNTDSWVSSGSSLAANGNTVQWVGHADSPVALFGWGLDYNRSVVNFADQAPLTTELSRARLIYQPDPELRFTGSVGYQTNDYYFSNTENAIFGGGVDWKPSNRTSASVYAEHQFFGTAYNGSFDHRTRLTAWHLGASQSASSYQQQLLTIPAGNTAQLLDAILSARIPDPVQRQAAVNYILQQTGVPATTGSPQPFYTNQIYISRSAVASFAIIGVRNTVTFAATRSYQQNISAAGTPLPAPLQYNNQFTTTGLAVSFSHQLSALTTLTALATRSYTYTYGPSAGTSTQDLLSLQASRTLDPKTSVNIGARYQSLNSATSLYSGYQERAIFGSINHRF